MFCRNAYENKVDEMSGPKLIPMKVVGTDFIGIQASPV